MLSLLIILILVVAGVAVYLIKPWENYANDKYTEDGKVSYVSLGTSNSNGFGLRGYMTEDEIKQLIDGTVKKEDLNVYGYQRIPDGSYPDLIKDHLSDKYGGKRVSVDQLGISSMRVEELRILLDESYHGDEYSEWRFLGEKGWFNSAEKGGLDALRSVYKEKISDADIITLDIGWNNFGSYVYNQFVEYLVNGKYMWSMDVKDIFDTEAEKKTAEEAQTIIRTHVNEYMGDNVVTEVLESVISYSVLGYIYNFDKVMEKIYELNPDADVIVIGIQNLLNKVVMTMEGGDLHLGDIFGNVADMANYYTSSCSPYHDRYLYVKAGENGHVDTFLNSMEDYNGDAAHINQNIRDCFDYYDDNLHLQSTLDNLAAEMIEQEFKSMIAIDGKDVLKLGKNGMLGPLQKMFDDMYWPALYAAYDTAFQLVKFISNTNSFNGDALINGADFSNAETALVDAITKELTENVMAAVNGEEYTVDINKIIPEDDQVLFVAASIFIRFYIGNSFFVHPSEQGHIEIKNAVIGILNDPEIEKEQTLPDDMRNSMRSIAKLLQDATGDSDPE